MKNKPIYGPVTLNFVAMCQVGWDNNIPQGHGWARKCALAYSNLPQLAGQNYYTVKIKTSLDFEFKIFTRKKRKSKAYLTALKALTQNQPMCAYTKYEPLNDLIIEPYFKEMENIQREIESIKFTRPPMKIEV